MITECVVYKLIAYKNFEIAVRSDILIVGYFLKRHHIFVFTAFFCAVGQIIGVYDNIRLFSCGGRSFLCGGGGGSGGLGSCFGSRFGGGRWGGGSGSCLGSSCCGCRALCAF